MIFLVIASLLHLCVEKPFINLENRILNPKPRVKPAREEIEGLIEAKLVVQDSN
jgi:hypothetical protein